MRLGLRTYFRCMLLNLEAEMKPGMQKWELPDKKTKNKNVAVTKKETSVAMMRIYVNDLGTE